MLEQIENLLIEEGLEYKKGGEYFMIHCPFAEKTHDSGTDDNPSFSIYPLRGFAKCFSCGIFFEIEEFLAEYSSFHNKNLDFEWLQNIINIKGNNKPLENYELPDNIMDGYEKNSLEIINYLKKRGIHRELIPFDLYYDPKFKFIYQPIKNREGKVVGATSRNTNKKGVKSHHAFGVVTGSCLLGHERNSADKILVVEGLTCVWGAYDCINQLGLSIDVYATLTANMTTWQAKALLDEDRPITLAFDMDKAGLKGRKKARNLLKDGMFTEVTWKEPIDVGDMNTQIFERLFG